MSPSVYFLGGLVLIWIVATGRAKAVWNAVTQGTGAGTTPPPTNVPGISPGTGVQPGERDPYQPPTTG